MDQPTNGNETVNEMNEWDALAIRLDRLEEKLNRILTFVDKGEAVLDGMASNPMLKMFAKKTLSQDEGVTIPVGDQIPGG